MTPCMPRLPQRSGLVLLGRARGPGNTAMQSVFRTGASSDNCKASIATQAATREPSTDSSVKSVSGAWPQDECHVSSEDSKTGDLDSKDTLGPVQDLQQARRPRQGWRGLPSTVKRCLEKNGVDNPLWTAVSKEDGAPADLKERVQYALRRRDELVLQSADRSSAFMQGVESHRPSHLPNSGTQ